MGNQYQILVDSIIKAVGIEAAKSCSIFIFGSSVLNMAHAHSDIDILVLSQEEIPYQLKFSILKKLRSKKISTYIFKASHFNQDRNHSFMEAAAFETAARYGQNIFGEIQLKSKMSDMALAKSMLMVALDFLKFADLHKNERLLAKELLRTTMLLWHLEKKLELKDIFSIAHFSHCFLERSMKMILNDPLFLYLEKSGIVFAWLDSDLTHNLCREELSHWHDTLIKRFKPFKNELNSLEFRPISKESWLMQKDYRAFQGVEWIPTSTGNIMMKDNGVRLIINLIK